MVSYRNGELTKWGKELECHKNDIKNAHLTEQKPFLMVERVDEVVDEVVEKVVEDDATTAWTHKQIWKSKKKTF